MSKNMTRKGLAFGVATAVVSASFAFAPANAAINDSAVSLTPLTGTQYSMVVDGIFDLKSTQSVAATAGSGELKYLVTDDNEISLFDYSVDLQANNTPETDPGVVTFNGGDGLNVAYNATTDIVTISDINGGNSTVFAGIDEDDIIYVDGMDSASITAANVFTGYVQVTDNTNDDSISFKVIDLNTVNFVAEALSAGAFTEESDTVQLDTFEVISAGEFGNAAITGLATPTRKLDGSYVVETGFPANPSTSDLLRIVATEAGSVKVQAWIDENGDDKIDSTEDASSVRTITFVTWANSGAKLNIETPVAGQEWEVYVSFNETINASQIVGTRLDVALGVLEGGKLESAVAGTAVNGAGTAFASATDSLTWDDDVEGFWGFTGALDTDVAGDGVGSKFTAGYTYAGQIFLDGEGYGEIVYTNIGNAVADDIGAIKATRSNNVLQDGTDVTVRSDYTGAVEFKVLLTENKASIYSDAITGTRGDVPVPAGTAVTVKVAEGTGKLDADSKISAGGKSLVRNGKAVEYTVLTDANGYAVFTVTNSQGEAGDDLDLTVTHAGDSVTANVTWNDARDNFSVLSGPTVVSTKAKGEVSIGYTAVDEFGAPLAGPSYRVVVSYYTAVGGTVKTTGLALDASGKATIKITDASTVLGTYQVTGTLQELNTSANYVDFGNPETVTTDVYVVSDTTPAKVTLVDAIDSAAGSPALELVPGKAIDTRAPNSPTAPAYDSDEEYTISGVVTNAAGAALRGTSVTISAPGLLFNTGALDASTAQNYTIGSITVTTSATGSYSVEVRSNLAGKHVVTVTAGTAKETETITFDEALEDQATQLVIDAPSNVAAGSSYSVTVSLKDAFGNPVETTTAGVFTLKYTGPGIALTVPSDTDSDGEAVFAVLLGSNDRGIGKITATYDGDDSATTVDNNFVVTKSVTVGSGAAAGAGKVNVGSFNGKLVVYAAGLNGARISWKVGGNWGVGTATSNYSIFNRPTPRAGVTVTVDIYVNGVKTLTKSVVTR